MKFEIRDQNKSCYNCKFITIYVNFGMKDAWCFLNCTHIRSDMVFSLNLPESLKSKVCDGWGKSDRKVPMKMSEFILKYLLFFPR